MSKLLTSRTCLGFTTNGHTGEEVFLACYHPQGTRATGLLTNIELNEYLCNLFGMTRETLEGQTAENFAPHQKVFADYQCTIVPSKEEKGLPTLVVKAKKGKKQLNITPNSNVVTYGKKGENTVQLNSVVVYVDQNNTFYLPKKLVEYLQ
jgi:alkaline phosphatase